MPWKESQQRHQSIFVIDHEIPIHSWSFRVVDSNSSSSFDFLGCVIVAGMSIGICSYMPGDGTKIQISSSANHKQAWETSNTTVERVRVSTNPAGLCWIRAEHGSHGSQTRLLNPKTLLWEGTGMLLDPLEWIIVVRLKMIKKCL